MSRNYLPVNFVPVLLCPEVWQADRCWKSDIVIKIKKSSTVVWVIHGERKACFGLHRCWWRLLETKCVDDKLSLTTFRCWWRFGHFSNQPQLSLYICFRHWKDVTNIETLSPTSRCHQHDSHRSVTMEYWSLNREYDADEFRLPLNWKLEGPIDFWKFLHGSRYEFFKQG